MKPEVLEEKIELLRWVINLNDEQVIKNLVNFKNEIFGVPFFEQKTCITSQGVGYQVNNSVTVDPRQSPDYLKFGGVVEGFSTLFEEALTIEEAKEQNIRKIQGWWRD